MSGLYAMPGNRAFAERLAGHLGCPCHEVQVHRFPDGESLVRIEPPAAATDAALVCTLDRPDPKLVPLLMAAGTLRDLGARRIGLVAPYLAYMRQDARFNPGEAISAPIFGRVLGASFDWLVTVDPHLHRYHRLGEVYPLDARVVHAARAVAGWIAAHVEAPLVIGPDDESGQWATDVAARLGVPSLVAHKRRRGDLAVEVQLDGLEQHAGRTPVLLDDIISSGRTMVETLEALAGVAWRGAPVCVGVHGIFALDARERLRQAGAGRVVIANTIDGDDAGIDISGDVAAAMGELGVNGNEETAG